MYGGAVYLDPFFGTVLVVWLLCSVALGYGLMRGQPKKTFPRDLGEFLITTLAVASCWGGFAAVFLMLPIAVLGTWLGVFS